MNPVRPLVTDLLGAWAGLKSHGDKEPRHLRSGADPVDLPAAALGGRDVKASVISFTLPSDVSAAARPRPLAARWMARWALDKRRLAAWDAGWLAAGLRWTPGRRACVVMTKVPGSAYVRP